MDFDDPPAIEQVQEQAGGERSYLKEDGSLVIDILVRQPCRASSAGEIVVCAPDPEEHRYRPPQPIVSEPVRAELQLAPNVKAVLRGETEARSGAQRAWIDVKLKF